MKIKKFQLNFPRFMERLKIMNDNILENISKETLRLISMQSNTFKEVLEIQNLLNTNATQQEKTIGVGEVKKWIRHLENERQKLEKMEMVLAVIGTMKAGKSTTINAIVGMEILPNRETAMTTLPTLIRNVHGQQQPILKISKIEPLENLSIDVAKKLNTLSEYDTKQIDLHGIEDGKSLIEGLRHNGVYHFKTEYQGQEGIFEFLKHLNDIMRLAKDKIIDISPPYGEYEQLDDLPVIEVEFCHLKGMKKMAHGSLAILDTPGPNEFGQSKALREVFNTQLEKASAILLVIDFTQMKTESEQDVRMQLATIEDQLSNNCLNILVNKFDNANKNSMSIVEIKNYVAMSLMEGKVETSQVFPASSYWAYLANCAKNYFDHHNNPPSHNEQPWVEDFGKEALGKLWENKINDIEEVKASLELLWKESYFEEPIEKVILEAHATAARKSLESAIDRLAYYNTEFLNMLSIRSNSMTKDIQDIKQMMQDLQTDISNCQEVEQKIHHKVEIALLELNNMMKNLMDLQFKEITDITNNFFEQGKATEKSELEAKKKERLKKLKEHNARNDLRDTFKYFDMFGILNDQDKKAKAKIEEKYNKLFDPTSPKITFHSKPEADTLYSKIGNEITSIFENADKELNSSANEIIKLTGLDISKTINTTVADTLERAKNKLNDNGNIELIFELPKIDLSVANIDSTVLFMASRYEKSETKWSTRAKDGVWGRICKLFGTSDWGRESYSYQDTTYIVDIEKIKTIVFSQLKKQVSHLSNQTGKYLKNEFEPRINEHLKSLEDYLNNYLGVLADGMKSSELNQADKAALKNRLEKLLKEQMVLKQDINVVKVTSLNGD